MPEPKLILDYASPRKQSKLRMKGHSTLRVDLDQGQCRVVEKLRAGKVTASLAIVFALFCTLFLALLLWSVIINGIYRTTGGATVVIVLAILPLIQLVIAAAVVQQTWRRTILIADRAGLRLSFWSVFKRQRFTWTTADLSNVSVIITEVTDAGRLGELVIDLFDGGRVRLFTDHRVSGLSDLSDLSAAIRSVTGWNQR